MMGMLGQYQSYLDDPPCHSIMVEDGYVVMLCMLGMVILGATLDELQNGTKGMGHNMTQMIENYR